MHRRRCSSRNVEAKAMNFHETRIEDIKAADAIAIGSSTFHYKMLPPLKNFIESLEKAKVANKLGSFRLLWMEAVRPYNDCRKNARALAWM